MKKAILAVSFGTTYAEAEQTCIRPVEAALAAGAYPISLGRRILRTETAGLTALSLLMFHLEA